ncbi:MAG: GNAT family N-acetyltransferase [Ilumatobacteraceae bacterium]
MLPLRTDRLTIRMMRHHDIGRLVTYRNDPAIGRFQDWELPFTEESARRVIDAQAPFEGPGNGRWVQLAVELSATGDLIGDVAVELRAGGAIATLGYTFAAANHGKGYATEAAGAVVDALCDAGVHRFVATLDPENVPSMRVLEAVGFTHECLAPQAELVRGEWVDDLRYSLLAAERERWRQRPRSRPAAVALVPLDDLNVDEFHGVATHYSQQRFVRPVHFALAQMAFPIFRDDGQQFVPEAFGVTADGVAAGFVQLANCSFTHDETYLWRLLIDRWHQRRGIGTEVLRLITERTRATGHSTLTVSYGEGPGSPGPLYRGFGFVPTGEIVADETVARLTL